MQNSVILTSLVENRAGVLNRIASLFRRRRFNIESLTVGHSEMTGWSRMTIVLNYATNVDQAVKQMGKLIEVREIKVLKNEQAIVRDLALIKLQKTARVLRELPLIQQEFAVKVVSQEAKNLILEIVDTPQSLEKFFARLQNFPIRKISKTGVTAI